MVINYELLRLAFNVTLRRSDGKLKMGGGEGGKQNEYRYLSVLPTSCPFLPFPPHLLYVLFVLMWKRIPCFILKLAPAPVGVQIALDSACDVCIFSLIKGTEVEYKIRLLR